MKKFPFFVDKNKILTFKTISKQIYSHALRFVAISHENIVTQEYILITCLFEWPFF